MILKRLVSAMKGRSFWLRLRSKYDVDDGAYVLLMPESDRELNEQALRHIDDLIAHRNARGVIILTNQKWIVDDAGNYSKQIISVNIISEEEIERLIALFELYAFTERLLIVSLTKPFGCKLSDAVGVQRITKEAVVCLSIFMIRSWENAEVGDGQLLKGGA